MLDYGAFTRSRTVEKLPKVPTLAELAREEAPELASVSGGECPRCKKPHADDDRHCQHCGAALRRSCGSCKKPLRDDQSFCPTCGGAAPVESSAAPQLGAEQLPSNVLPLFPPPPPAPEWTPDDCFLVGAGVDVVLVKLKADLMDEQQRDRVNTKAAAVANKHFRIGGRWREEIGLGMAICGVIFPAAYTYFVLMPDEERQKKAAAADAERAP